MIDRIFEMVMMEARKRPGDNLLEKAFHVMLEIDERICVAFELETKNGFHYPSKYTKTA